MSRRIAGLWGVVAVTINCPTPGCGGGVQNRDGSYMLESTDVLELADEQRCDECGLYYRVPVAARRAIAR